MWKKYVVTLLVIMVLISSAVNVHAMNTTVSGGYNGYSYTGGLTLTRAVVQMQFEVSPKNGAILLPITVEVNGNARTANNTLVRINEKVGGEYCEASGGAPTGSYFVSAVGEYLMDGVTVDESALYLENTEE